MRRDNFRCWLLAGECLFSAGDAGDYAYVVENGRVEIFTGDGNAPEVVARLGPGEIFGESALIGEQHRSASARAVEDTELTVVTADYVRQRLNAADPLIRHLLNLLAARTLQNLGGSALPTPRADKTDRDLALNLLRLEQDIEAALLREEFELEYQPIVALPDGRLLGFEALIRWNRPGIGRVSPAQFIPVAESCGLIVPMGHWIVRRACMAIAELSARSQRSLFVSVNVSGRQLVEPTWLDEIAAVVQRHALSPGSLRLEITESLLVNHIAEARELLQRCQKLGIKLAVDDFGTGYSSLAYLQHLPVDVLKLDRAFVKGLEPDSRGAKIVRAVVGLAADMGMSLVAEGVETAAECAALCALKVPAAQGYLFGRSMPLRDALAMASSEAPAS